eukprot:TRINITY_DN2109_c0_g2_i1.p1 TRINITY_DN2109_c0_g2~~TRINITY_DN2109_c0_g2_i1.p1  ORF type:complete len:379 (+),score=84.98 TRINITY_DN2109_c0_g2_i1:49-1137(+)
MDNNYSLSLFTDKGLSQTFSCRICHNVPLASTAMSHGKCGSVFCSSCITGFLNKDQKCPQCSEYFTIDEAKDTNRTLSNFIQTLKMECPYKEEGCGWKGDFADLGKHIEEDRKTLNLLECPYKPAGCPNFFPSKALDKHLASKAKEHAEMTVKYAKEKERELNIKKEMKLLNEKGAALLPGLLSGTSVLSRHGNPVVFIDVGIGKKVKERIVMHLFANMLPRTVENFRQFCVGIILKPKGKVLTYKGTKIHRVIPGFIMQGGDVVKGNGTGTTSIYGESFEDEGFIFKHDREGVLSMANAGPNSNGCQFFITLNACPWVDEKFVAFGEVIHGMDFVKEVEKYGTPSGGTRVEIKILECGQLY